MSWKLGTSGFAIKTGLGIYVAGRHRSGTDWPQLTVGNPWWTFQPELIVSYLANGWNLTAFLYEEFNTAKPVDDYTKGDIFHADFTATKTIGKWTLGPVGYYVGQVSNDKCAVGSLCGATPAAALAATGSAMPSGSTSVAVGGLVEYNFGPASLSVWATQEICANAKNSAGSGRG